MNELAAGWVDFVKQFPWSWFCTFTYRDSANGNYIHPEAAVKVHDRMIHNLNREIFGVRYYKRPQDGVVVARASEFQNRGAIHFHDLIGRVPAEVDRFKYMDIHNELGGYARIYPYGGSGCGAEEYICKSAYAFKKGDIDLLGPMRYLQEGQPLSQHTLFA